MAGATWGIMEQKSDLITVFGVWAGTWKLVYLAYVIFTILLGLFVKGMWLGAPWILSVLSFAGLFPLLLLWRGFRLWMAAAFLLFEGINYILSDRLMYAVLEVFSRPEGADGAGYPFTLSPYLTYAGYIAAGYVVALLLHWLIGQTRAPEGAGDAETASASRFATFQRDWFPILAALAGAGILYPLLAHGIEIIALWSGVSLKTLIDWTTVVGGFGYVPLLVNGGAAVLVGGVAGVLYRKRYGLAPDLRVALMVLLILMPNVLGQIRYLADLYAASPQGPITALLQALIPITAATVACGLGFYFMVNLSRLRGRAA